MAFYLRKHFNTGPLRLNLSRGGLGVSGGVKGARVGLGPKGAYVHGGRHGLYYRKYARDKGEVDDRDPGEVSYFIDTGLTCSSGELGREREIPSSPPLPGHSRFANALLVAGFLLALLWFGTQDSIFLITGIVILLSGVALNSSHQKQREEARKLVERIGDELGEKESVSRLLDLHENSGIKKAYRPWTDYHVFALFQDAFYEDPGYILPEELSELESRIMIPKGLTDRLKADVYSEFLDEIIEDHMITEEEEEKLAELERDLGINSRDIERERYIINQICQLRDASQQPPDVIQAGMPLKKGEKCFYRGQGRLLKERIFRQYQRQLVKYKETGYDIDMEGEIFICTGRILISGSGSRSYDLTRILNITLSLEDHTVQLALDGRKSPLIITVPDIAVFAGKLKQLTGIN